MSIRDIEPGGEAHTPSAYRTPTDVERPTLPPDGRPLAEQPKWRRDFPIDWPQDEYVSRRDLVKFMVLTSLAFATGQFWLLGQNLLSPRHRNLPRLAIAGVDEVPVGGHKTFEYPEGSAPRLLIRTGETSFVAYDQQCTHLLCPVIPVVAESILHCPCHHGVFDLATGRQISGPPPRPLPRVTLEIRDGTVYATGMEERTT
ncbi:MAG TPA: Rieske (2Fe-2S) protein [Rhodothermales bacterium]|nr:Rieske (2Fe-2S) protein [Rhodothermales bacterium]